MRSAITIGVIGALIISTSRAACVASTTAPKIKQSERRAIGLVPYPRVGRSPHVSTMMAMKYPRVGRSFLSEPEVKADLILDNSDDSLPLDVRTDRRGNQKEFNEVLEQFHLLLPFYMTLADPHFGYKLTKLDHYHVPINSSPWNYFYSHQDPDTRYVLMRRSISPRFKVEKENSEVL